MKIWLDITNAPHINFFAPFVEQLKSQHTLIITARDHSNTIDMLELEGWPYTLVGAHYGGKAYQKILGFFHRTFALWRFLKKKNIDVAISHSSFYSPLVAKLLGSPSIYINDNEHALGNIVAFLFADRIMVPEMLNIKKLKRQFASEKKLIPYPGVKEAIYLSYLFQSLEKENPEKDGQKKIYIRPEPWNAQYYKADQFFLTPLIQSLSQHFKIVVLPRGRNQTDYYQNLKSSNITIMEGAAPLEDIYRDCALFIGAGGTMTREMAILGIPTLSVYRGELLNVDRFLTKAGFMTHITHPTVDDVIRIAETQPQKNSASLINQGIEARNLIMNTLIDLGSTHERCKSEVSSHHA